MYRWIWPGRPEIRSTLMRGMPARRHAIDVAQGDFSRVKAPGLLRFGIDEGLHSEADAVYAALDHRGKSGILKLARSAFDGDLGARKNDKFASNDGEEAMDKVRRQQRRRASAKIDGVNHLRQFRVPAPGSVADRGQVVFQAGDILLEIAGGEDSRGEVAVSAFRLAKRYGEVQAESLHLKPIFASGR